MIPSISQTSPVQQQYLAFIEALRACGFEGDLNPDYANRTVLSTDNSVYQVLPQGVIYPKNSTDLVRLAELSNVRQFRDIVLSPRGGGTGTNGQSLSDGLIVDISKHMNKILEINPTERWVRVQAGVVKDQLNEALKPHGLFFAPELSTSNRATIGGMVNTDASGQGSCRYGKTRDHVLELLTVFLDGNEWRSQPLTDEELASICERQDRVGEAHRVVHDIQREHHQRIADTFPALNRCLTGYDLAHIRTADGKFDLNSVLCGSEGTLGFIAEVKLNLLPIPKYSALVNVQYDSFNGGLRDATELMKSNPTSIETVDSKVLGLAMKDIVWESVSTFFPDTGTGRELKSINLVEYTADDEATLKADIAKLTAQLDQRDDNSPRMGYSITWGDDSVKKIWGMRKKAVGLLGNAQGEARPIPFVEDTAVPPEHLADFIAEFRQLLDDNNLQYGMFGHVDAGVLHVRPAIDMKDPEQAKLLRPITDKVVELTRKYKGLLWGEHGKGLRSEYAPEFFGELYPQLQRIKATFDPRNQLNPGKIATPSNDFTLTAIDAAPTRGEADRIIPVHIWEGYSEGMYCNGNGLCFNWSANDPMCPSWKGTRERIHSPKGRASLIREWLKQLSERNIDPLEETRQLHQQNFLQTLPARIKNTWQRAQGEYDFSNEVFTSMSGCLACNSCVGLCPVNVDVPDFRSIFLELYYGRYLRPLKDYFIGGLEFVIPTMAKVPWLYNGLMKPHFMQKLLAKVAGMVDSPLLTGINLDRELQRLNVPYATPELLQHMSDIDKASSVILVQDAFTSFFETQLLLDMLRLLKILGFKPLVAPFTANGKPLHVHGFLKMFSEVAADSAAKLRALQNSGITLAGIEPSMTLAYRSEYVKTLGANNAPNVLLIQEWLANQTHYLKTVAGKFRPNDFKLLAHCTEKTNAAPSIKAWQTVFTALGQTLVNVDVGCCGMAGTYGHEAANRDTSKTIYQLSWHEVVTDPANQGKLVASGYSCRSQVKREDKQQLAHPLQALLAQLQDAANQQDHAA